MTAAPRRAGMLAAMSPVVIFLLLAAALLASRGVIVKLFLHDIFFLFDGLWRASLGEVAHVDFHTPVGQAYFWPFMLLGRLGDHDALTVIHAHVLIGAVLTAAMVALLPRRLTPLELLLTSIAILAMAMAPRDVDARSSYDYSWLAPYNRWSWAIWMVTVQAVLIRPVRERHGLDGAILGILAGLMLYTKLTFFAGAAALALVAILFRWLPLRTALIAAATLIVMILGVELIWHNNLGYWQDLHMAMAGAAEGHYEPRLAKLFTVFFISRHYWLVIPLMFWLARPTDAFARWLGFWWRPMGAALLVLAVGMGISLQNFPEHEYGHLVLALLIAWQLSRRTIVEVAPAALPPRLPGGPAVLIASSAMIVLIIAWSLLSTAKDLRSIATHMLQTRDGSACPIPALGDTQGSALMVPAKRFAGAPKGSAVPTCDHLPTSTIAPDPAGDNQTFYLRKLERTMHLIRRHARPGEVILALDFSNPYPFLLRTKAPEHALLWMDLGRNHGYSAHPPAEPILRSVDLVIQARLQADEDNYHAGRAWAIYGGAVSRYFHIVGENETARLWRRNGR